MRRLLAALLWLAAVGSAAAQNNVTSALITTPTSLTVSGSTFTPSCPNAASVSGVYNVVATAASQTIALPTCPSSSVGLFVTFNLCNGKGSTAPCNGTASGPFTPGLIFGAGYEFPATSVYAVTALNGNNVSGAKDIVTCEVMGTSGPWSCGSPQYAMLANAAADTWQTPGGSFCSNLMALSNSNLTATISSGGAWASCYATTSHTTGQYYFFLTASALDSGNGWIGGFANASNGTNTLAGASLNGVGYQGSLNTIWFNGNSNTAGGSIAQGSVVRFDVDLTNKKLGLSVNGGTEFPSGCNITGAQTNCFDFSSWNGGAAYPVFSGLTSASPDAAILNVTSGAGPGAPFVLWQ